MKKEYEFIGESGGDGECFHFIVDEETYALFNKEILKKFWKMDLYRGKNENKKHKRYIMGPGQFFDNYGVKKKIKITIEDI